MAHPILYVDRSEIREGRLEELRLAVGGLAAFIEANVPRAISYNVYFDPEGTRMVVAQIQPDSAALEFHMRVGAPEFLKLRDLITLTAIEVYGEPSEELLEQLRRKALALGGEGEGATVSVFDRRAGFDRF